MKQSSPSESRSTPLDEIVLILSRLETSGSFAASRTASAKDLHLEVREVGLLRFPLTRRQARQLVAIGRPARFGLGEKTVLDLQVRNCTEIPLGRVKLDARRFQRTLAPMLETLRVDLGLAAGAGIKAELQSMLVYGPGQFFAKHKDSEKDDSMVASLVVTLPSSFAGGALTIEHQGEKLRCGGTKDSLSFVAFYADCEHAVNPVTSGYRVALTYILSIAGAKASPIEAEPKAVKALVPSLESYFTTVRPPRNSWRRDKPAAPGEMLFLLDHEYTERGLDWAHLKGEDAPRGAALRAAAAAAGCEATLALAALHESWSAFEGDDHEGFGRRRYYEDHDDEDLDDADDPDGEDYELGELLDSDTTIDRWLDPDTGVLEKIHKEVDGDAIAFATPNSDLTPDRSEYEGYMGNYGNTVDRWYRRAGVLIWSRERGVAMRAGLSPGWMLRKAKESLAAKDPQDATRLVEAMLPSWNECVARDESNKFLSVALKLAQKVASPELATSLMEPFRLEELSGDDAPYLAALLGQYGEPWWQAVVTVWTKGTRSVGPRENPEEWVADFGRLAEALAASSAPGVRVTRLIAENRWSWLAKLLEPDRDWQRPSEWRRRLVSLARPFLGLLQAIEVAGADDLGRKITEFFLSPGRVGLLPLVLEALALAKIKSRGGKTALLTLAQVREHAIAQVREELRTPERALDDWSIDWKANCKCNLCVTLGRFFADPARRMFEWPLASSDRAHVHGKIEFAELPVTHQTRRTGRPYTLVLTKTPKLFAQRATARRQLQEALARLTSEGPQGDSVASRPPTGREFSGPPVSDPEPRIPAAKSPARSRTAPRPPPAAEADGSMDLFRDGEEVSTADLAALGLSRKTFQPWIQARLLEPTGRRGVYRAAKALNAVILEALVNLR